MIRIAMSDMPATRYIRVYGLILPNLLKDQSRKRAAGISTAPAMKKLMNISPPKLEVFRDKP